MQNKSNNKKNSPTTTAFIGAILTLLGGFFLFYNYNESKEIVAHDYMAHKFYDTVQEIKIQPVEILESEDYYRPGDELSDEITNDYIGYLTIPKINLTKGFLDVRSEENDVDKNIMVIEGSNYPDVDRGNFMIAGHSGTGWKAFFKDLHKLGIGDIAYINYKGKKYTYTIKNIYLQPKTGTLAVYRNESATTLTLITCTNNDSKTQTIFIAELTNIEE